MDIKGRAVAPFCERCAYCYKLEWSWPANTISGYEGIPERNGMPRAPFFCRDQPQSTLRVTDCYVVQFMGQESIPEKDGHAKLSSIAKIGSEL